MQAENFNQELARNLAKAIVNRPGLPVEKTDTNTLSDSGKIYDSGGYVAIKAIDPPGLDENFNPLFIPADVVTSIQIPDDGVTRNVYLKYQESNVEAGTIDVASDSTTVTGHNTDFTNLKADMLIEIADGSLAGEERTIVADPASATELTVDSNWSAAQNGATFKVKGDMLANSDYVHYFDSYQLRLDSGAAQAGEIQLATVTRTGGSSTIVDKRDDHIIEVLPRSVMAALNDLLFEKKLDGGYILTANTQTVKKPLNLTLAEVSYLSASAYIDTNDIILAKAAQAQDTHRKVRARLTWNYHVTLSGTGTNTLQFDPAETETLVADEVINYMVWIPSVAKDYQITDNGTDTLTVDAGEDDLSGITSEEVIIHPEADSYIIAFTKYTAGGVLDKKSRLEQMVAYGASPIEDDRWIDIDLGRYNIEVYAMRGGKASAKAKLTNQLVKLPNITADGNVSAIATDYGFDLTIGGWNNATAFEVLVSTDALDWNSASQQRRVIHQRTTSFTVDASGKYNVGVRPLIMGQVVGNPVTDSVSTTGGGSKPDILHKTITINLTAGDTTEASRQLARYLESSSIEITRMVFDPSGSSQDDSALRIYPLASPTDERYLPVTDDKSIAAASMPDITFDDPLDVTEQNGTFGWVVSAYDDRQGADNAKVLSGRLDIEYRYKIRTKNVRTIEAL